MYRIVDFLSIFVFAVLYITISGCNGFPASSKVSEGKITYGIEFFNSDDNVLVPLLPQKIEMKFKNNNSIIVINGFMGTFSLNYVTLLKKNKSYSMLRVFDKKFIYNGDTSSLSFGYSNMKNVRIEKTNDTATIAGYLCHKALAYCPDVSQNPFELFYTNDIRINRPNVNNPFKDLDGVLLGFQVILCGINMKFTALDVVSEKINDSIFEVPEGYTPISCAEMEDMINQYN